jgi:Ca2+-binding EF-hand superfamily protein
LAAALAAFCAAPLASFAQSNDAPAATATAHPSLFEHMLKKMDTDGDGRISSAEFQAAAAARFDAIDTQGTGKITAEQIANSKFAKDRDEKIAEHEVQKIGSNGVITKDQYLAAAQARFAKLDKNGDGYITADEMPAGRPGLRKPNNTNSQ